MSTINYGQFANIGNNNLVSIERDGGVGQKGFFGKVWSNITSHFSSGRAQIQHDNQAILLKVSSHLDSLGISRDIANTAMATANALGSHALRGSDVKNMIAQATNKQNMVFSPMVKSLAADVHGELPEFLQGLNDRLPHPSENGKLESSVKMILSLADNIGKNPDYAAFRENVLSPAAIANFTTHVFQELFAVTDPAAHRDLCQTVLDQMNSENFRFLESAIENSLLTPQDPAAQQGSQAAGLAGHQRIYMTANISGAMGALRTLLTAQLASSTPNMTGTARTQPTALPAPSGYSPAALAANLNTVLDKGLALPGFSGLANNTMGGTIKQYLSSVSDLTSASNVVRSDSVETANIRRAVAIFVKPCLQSIDNLLKGSGHTDTIGAKAPNSQSPLHFISMGTFKSSGSDADARGKALDTFVTTLRGDPHFEPLRKFMVSAQEQYRTGIQAEMQARGQTISNDTLEQIMREVQIMLLSAMPGPVDKDYNTPRVKYMHGMYNEILSPGLKRADPQVLSAMEALLAAPEQG